MSVYRPPGEARYCTAEMLDTEEYLIASAKMRVDQAVTDDEADQAVTAGNLSKNQQEVVKGLLTSKTATTVLVGPAGRARRTSSRSSPRHGWPTRAAG